MKVNLRILLNVIRRFKLAVVLNILGLSVAFAAFMVIMVQINYDYGFDRFHKNYDKIFRLEFSRNTSVQSVISCPLAEQFFESSPHILAGAITGPGAGTSRFHVENGDIRNYYEDKSLTVTPDFFNVFSFDFIEGSTEDYIAPENIFIPLSLSRKLFGNEPAVGKQIVYNDRGNQTVMKVYRDFPSNSTISNCIYRVINEFDNKEGWNNWSYHTYIRVDDPSNASLIIDNFKRNMDESVRQRLNWDEESGTFLRLTALKDIHYVTGVSLDSTQKANKQTLMIMFAIAIVIVSIAGINFTNFSTALTPMRIKTINTQRIFGAGRISLRISIVFETVCLSLLSYFIALLLFVLFFNTPLTKLIDADLTAVSTPLIAGGAMLIALLTGLFAGLYPARYMTSFAPALVLKGNFGLTPKGKKMRNMMTSIQFIASFALIIGASFMYLQNHFMQDSPLGYDKDEIITANIAMIHESHEIAFTNQLKTYSGIEDVTYGASVLSSADRYMGWGRMYKGAEINFQCLPVHYTFLKVMGVEITEGRDFRVEDTNKQLGVFVFNEAARNKYNLEIGTMVERQGEIIGFMPDVKFASLRKEVEPMAFYVWGTENWGRQTFHVFIKVKAGTNMRAAMSHIHATLAEFNPDWEYPFNVRFYDEVLQQLYEKEIALNLLITLFSLIAIFISIVGVFGLVVFDSEYRRKEVGIRKIHGASTISIITMFNKVYFKMLLICFVIASPFAWYAVHRWLENFAYKTPMYGWVYLLAFVVVGIIIAATVTFQTWRVANDNPVKAIKND